MSHALPLPRSGLYFIDVLACSLFCLTLALVGARFQRDHAVEIELPEFAAVPAHEATGASLDAETITIRSTAAGPEFFLGDEAVSLGQLESRLRDAPPLAVLIRAESSALSEVISAAHGAGVHDIQLAYELDARGGEE